MRPLPILILIAALMQPMAAIFLVDTTSFINSNSLNSFITPAPFSFSIWSVLYVLSIIFAFYQFKPKNDNQLLRAIRIPTLVIFSGSSLWLWFSSFTDWRLWLTIPTIMLMLACFYFIIRQPNLNQPKIQFFSKDILLAYAAWIGVAAWLNVQTISIDKGLIINPEINFAVNILILVVICFYNYFIFKKTNYNLYYGLVLAWAGLGIVLANIVDGSYLIAMLAGAVGLIVLTLLRR